MVGRYVGLNKEKGLKKISWYSKLFIIIFLVILFVPWSSQIRIWSTLWHMVSWSHSLHAGNRHPTFWWR